MYDCIDCPSQAARQYYVLDTEGTDEVAEDFVDRKFECRDEDESKPATAPPDGGNKRNAPPRRQSAPKKKDRTCFIKIGVCQL